MPQHPPSHFDGSDGPAARSARTAAQRLTADYGPRLAPDVEAALSIAGSAGRPEQYLDPISLAALIVSAAQFGWSVYTDLRTKTAKPSADVIARRVRVEMAERADTSSSDLDRVIAVVTEEIVQQASAADRPQPQ